MPVKCGILGSGFLFKIGNIMASERRGPTPNPPADMPEILEDTGRSEYTRRMAPASQAPMRSRPASNAREVVPPAMQQNAHRQRSKQNDSGWYLPWWSLILMVIVVGASALAFIYFIASFDQPQIPGNQTPSVREITSQPTLSQDFASGGPALPSYPNPTSIPQALPSPTVALPTPVPSQTMPPGEFIVGTRIQVVGVGSDGLNVRSTPGLDGAVNFQAYDDEIFVIVDGPQIVDDREWWKLEDPEDSYRGGWAVRNFLMIVVE
jgi:hypothetical protein